MAEDEVGLLLKENGSDPLQKATSCPAFVFLWNFFNKSPNILFLNCIEKVLAEHYGELKEKPFFPGLLEYIKVKLLFVFDKKKTIQITHLVIITIIAFVSQALSSRWPGREKESLRRPGKTFP